MTGKETLSDTAFEALQQRFTSFVESHSAPSTSGLGGAIRDGEYTFNARDQLVPVNRATFSQFLTGDTQNPTPEDVGWAITLSQDETERFTIYYTHGNFNESDSDFGVSPRPLEPGVVSSFLDRIEEVTLTVS